jgi:AsmA protein
MEQRGMPRAIRVGLWSLAAVVALAIVGAGIFVASFDPDSLKPRIIAAVKQQTGRDLTLQGRIRLGLSLQPTLTVQGVALANPPGFSRPQMATLDRLDLKLALIPLLSRRVEIDRLVLVKPDILLETDAKGRPNWQFTPAPSEAAAQPAPTGAKANSSASISVADVRIEDGTLAWRDAASGHATVVGIRSLQASAASPDANPHLSAAATYNGAPFTLIGEFGPLARLQDPAGAPWPVRVSLESAGAKLALDGTFTQPLQARGYTVKLAGSIPDLAALSPFAPGSRLPALRDVSLSAQAADTGAGLPEISGLTLHVGPSDLTGTVAGLRLDGLDVAAARLDQPVQLSGQGSFDDAPATLAGTIGAPAGLLSGAGSAGPVPLDLSLKAAGSNLAVKGTVAAGPNGRLALQGDVKSDMIDADKLAAAFGKPSGGSPSPPAAPPAGAPAKPAASGRMIPDTPIPFDMLRPADADVTLSIGELKSGGAAYRAIKLHLALHDGQLRLDPFSADLPEGHLDASLTADARQPAPPVALRLHAPGLAVQSVLAALRMPGYATGRLEVYADLRGAGATPHAIASGLDGSLGLAMVNGTVDDRLLGSTLGNILKEVNLLDLVGRGGSSQIECFAARLDASHGVGTFRALLLRSSLLTLDGDGSMNLGAETLDLHVRPQGRVGGTGLVVPMRVGGSFHAPSAAPDPAATVAANAGTVAGVLSHTTPLGAIAGAMGGQRLLGGGAECGPALAIARGQPGGAVPAGQAAQPAQPSQQQKPKTPDAGALLKQLFR